MLRLTQLERKNTPHIDTQTEKENTMNTNSAMMETVKSSYLALVLSILGVFAVVSAVLIAWPALSYLGARMFN